MTRLETIHALLRRLEDAYSASLNSPALEELGAAPATELFAQLSECRELFAEELRRVITSLRGELISPRALLENPRELRSALSRALHIDPDVPELMSDSLSSAARSILS